MSLQLSSRVLLGALGAVVVAAASVLAVPRACFACCADIDTIRVVGWSASGEVVVEHLVSSECTDQRVLEWRSAEAVRARFDMQNHGRAIARFEDARALGDEALWDLVEARGGADVVDYGDLFPVPARLTRGLAEGMALGAEALVVEARPGPTEATRPEEDDDWHQTAVLSVSLAVGARGRATVLEGVTVPRFLAEELDAILHVSPDGRRGLVVFHTDDPDAMVDQAHWVSLPPGALDGVATHPSDGLRGARALPAATFPPSTRMLDEDLRYLFDDAAAARAEWLAAVSDARDEDADDAAALLSQSTFLLLWARPGDAAIRARYLDALALASGHENESALADEAPRACGDAGPCPFPPADPIAATPAPAGTPAASAACARSSAARGTSFALLPLGLTALALGVRRRLR